MYTRVLTYDLRNGSSDDYQDLYDYFKSVNAVKLTESSYLIETSLSWDDFEQKIRRLTKYGDNVKAVVYVRDKGLSVFDIR